MSVRILHLVRHGAAEGDYAEDPGLSERGRRQATIAGERLAASLQTPIARVVSSDLRRAIETGDLIARALGQVERVVDPSLREGFPTKPADPRARAGLDDSVFEEEAERFETCWSTFFVGSETKRAEVLVSHGNWIRGLTMRALGGPLERWPRLGFNHCAFTSVMMTPDGPYVVRVNDSGHLPPELVTVK